MNNKEVIFRDIPKYGDLMPLEEFIDYVEDGGFIDCDGSGELATSTQVSNVDISPSDIGWIEIPEWVTHVVWYNK